MASGGIAAAEKCLVARAAWVALLCACACSRSLEVPRQGTRSAGAACDQAVQCDSAICGEGVCCAAACAPSESCAVPGHLGSCAPRALGAPCRAGADCPGGFCADGVCCESACNGTCQTCAVHPGKCEDAPDNTDARRECGLCSACFQRVCAPALPGTDPNQRCPAGQTCGASQSCGKPGGAACTADADCAVGVCLAGRCEQVTVEHIFQEPMVQSATGRSVRNVAISSSGGVGVAFGEYSQTGTDLPSESELFLAQRSPAGSWLVTDLFSDRNALRGGIAAAVGYLGPTAIVVASSDEVTAGTCPAPGAIPCGVFATLVSPGGQAGRPEIVDATAQAVLAVVVHALDDGRIFAAYDAVHPGESGHAIFLRRRDVTASGVAWVAAGKVAPPSNSWVDISWDFDLVDQKPVVVVSDYRANTLAMWQPSSPTPDPATLPPVNASTCDPELVQVRRAGAAGSQRAFVTVACTRATFTATWSSAAHWRLVEYPGGAQRLDPLGDVGGVPAAISLLPSPDTRASELHYAVSPGTGPGDRLVYRPRGAEDLASFASALDGQQLPQIAVSTGLVETTPTTLVRGLNLYLVRVHP